MKTATRLRLSITLFLLISINLAISAQKPVLFNDIEPLLAELVSDIKVRIILSSEATSSSPDLYYENELRLEPWMFGFPAWINTNISSKNLIQGEEIIENKPDLEEWMLRPFVPWYLVPEKEEKLRLEDWMLNMDEWI